METVSFTEVVPNIKWWEKLASYIAIAMLIAAVLILAGICVFIRLIQTHPLETDAGKQ